MTPYYLVDIAPRSGRGFLNAREDLRLGLDFAAVRLSSRDDISNRISRIANNSDLPFVRIISYYVTRS